MLENALYSVISPRGCASILWKDASREIEAAECLKITAQDLYGFGMVEGIIPETPSIMKNVKKAIATALRELSAEAEQDIELLLQKGMKNSVKSECFKK